jgi:hypothetical protein
VAKREYLSPTGMISIRASDCAGADGGRTKWPFRVPLHRTTGASVVSSSALASIPTSSSWACTSSSSWCCTSSSSSSSSYGYEIETCKTHLYISDWQIRSITQTFISVLRCRAIGVSRSSGQACLSNASCLLWLEELPWKRERAPGSILLAALRNPLAMRFVFLPLILFNGKTLKVLAP